MKILLSLALESVLCVTITFPVQVLSLAPEDAVWFSVVYTLLNLPVVKIRRLFFKVQNHSQDHISFLRVAI